MTTSVRIQGLIHKAIRLDEDTGQLVPCEIRVVRVLNVCVHNLVTHRPRNWRETDKGKRGSQRFGMGVHFQIAITVEGGAYVRRDSDELFHELRADGGDFEIQLIDIYRPWF